MIVEAIIGNLEETKFQEKTIEYVDIEWHEAFSKLHRKTTKEGTEVGIRLGNEVLTRGLRQDDVLYADAKKVIAVNIPPCEVIEATVAADHPRMREKLCYEVGNRHATLFWGDADNTFVTPYNEPMLVMLSKLHGVTAVKKTQKLNFHHAISSTVNAHTH